MVVRVRPVLTHELSEPIAVTCSVDGTQVQVSYTHMGCSSFAIVMNSSNQLVMQSRGDAVAQHLDLHWACVSAFVSPRTLGSLQHFKSIGQVTRVVYCAAIQYLIPSARQVVLPEKETSKPALAASTRPDAKAYGFDACLTGNTTQVIQRMTSSLHSLHASASTAAAWTQQHAQHAGMTFVHQQ